jgi:HSP20 family protein
MLGILYALSRANLNSKRKEQTTMKLIRYAYPQSQASSAFNRIFDPGAPALGRLGSFMDDFFASEAGLSQPAVDLYENEYNYYARFELPGVKKEEIDLELENSVLTLKSQVTHKEGEAEAEETTHCEFERSISVPDGVDLEQVSAALADGILTVTMPKLEVRKPRQISVN